MLSKPLRVFLCAPQGLARLMLHGLLENFPLIQVIGQAGVPALARARLAMSPADLLVIDADQADGIDFDLLQAFQQGCPNLPMVVVTLFLSQSENATRLLELGVRAGMDKCATPQQFAALLTEVVRQPRGFAVVLGAPLAEETEAIPTVSYPPTEIEGLTAREEKLLALLLQGRRLRTIATELNLGEQTVRNYASVLYQKLQVSSKAELLEKYGHRVKR